MSFDPRMRGLTLSNSQTIRSAHNSMAQQALFEFDQKAASKVSFLAFSHDKENTITMFLFVCLICMAYNTISVY